MNLNIIRPKLELKPQKLNSRAKLDIGLRCNYRCPFCYYYKSLNDSFIDLEIIKKRIRYLNECGIEDIDISGGEPSIRPDFKEILSYIKEVNPKINISCLTNGSKFHNKEFLKECRDLGLKEILFSLHGVDEETHNKMVGNISSAFKNIIKSIENCYELDIITRINTVVNNDNYSKLGNYNLDFFNSFKNNVSQINFLPMNYWSDANKKERIHYSYLTETIKGRINVLKSEIKEINVRYVPYCYMKGYEQYVVSTYDHIYDLKDWNIVLYDYKVKPEDYKENFKELFLEQVYKNRKFYFKKDLSCKGCKMYNVCDGYEKNMNIKVFKY